MSNFTDEEKEIAIYGLKRLGIFLISIVVGVTIGVIMGNVQGVVLFLLFFIPLRIFAGGLHLPTIWMCAIASSLLIIIVAFILNISEGAWTCGIIIKEIIMAGALVIMLLAPVDTANKPLFKEEKTRYKIISIVITVVEVALFFISHNNNFIKMLIFLVIMIEAAYMTVQKILNYANLKR